jgi:poly-gamma-glutamate capsule biosynthesis protein CapA/YwtB (metallophosphatase superfamily)
MCGRGIDQVLAQPCSPEIYEHYLRSAEAYVRLAEQANGPIPRRNGSSYVWGAALGQLERMQPDARIINLETAVTRSHDRVNKGINYRMSPENAECLAAAKINCCVLANNHVLDWGRAGLLETLTTLQKLNVKATRCISISVVALERDPEKETQRRYGLVDGRYTNAARRWTRCSA